MCVRVHACVRGGGGGGVRVDGRAGDCAAERLVEKHISLVTVKFQDCDPVCSVWSWRGSQSGYSRRRRSAWGATLQILQT